MRFIHYACFFVIVISVLVVGQSDGHQFTNQSHALPMAQPRHQALAPTLYKVPQGAPLTRRGTGAPKAIANGRRPLPMQGLNFANAVAYDSGGYYAQSVAVADVNGDGKPDLVVANECVDSDCSSGSVGVLLANGDGTFQPAVTYGSGGDQPRSVAVADVNGDGKPDLLVANCTSTSGCLSPGIVGVLLGNGDGTFQPVVTYGSGADWALFVAVADVNGDGKPDLLIANQCFSTSNCTGAVGVLLGNGDGTFQTAVAYGSGGNNGMSVAVADVNGDGKPDLLVANFCVDNGCANSSVGVLLGNGDGTFQTAVAYGSGGNDAYSVAVADVNGDGKPDVLLVNECVVNDCQTSTVGVLLGNGDGTFQSAVSYSSGGGGGMSVAVADVNGDGKPDLLVAEEDGVGTVGVLLGNGDGTFQTAVAYGSGGYNYGVSVAVADVNADGKPDLLVANLCGDTGCVKQGTVGVLINTSVGSTTTALTSSPNPSSFGQAVTFTATLTSHFFKLQPTGTVSFFDGTTNIGNSNLNNSGVATLTTSTLAVGTHSMTATYNGDSNFAPSTSPVLYQVVQGAIAVLSPTNLNFGNQTVGITSSPQNVTLQNNGNINLTITSIQITGANSGDFGQKNNCPSSLSPNNSCQITVTFTPTATGTRNGAASITDNAPGSPQSVPLTGVGVVPDVNLSPTSLTFATQTIFTTSPAQPVQLKNTGLGVLVISKIAVGGAFIQTNDCPKNVNPGTQCTISVKFHPKNKGVLKADLSVVDNAPGSPQKVSLTGTGTLVQLTPTKVNFGTQPVGTRSLPKRIAVTNKGDASVNIAKISITGTDAGDFAETNTCGKQLASGASCFVKVTFKPLRKGKRTADVSISDDGGGSPQEAALSGTGT
jgi:hypothetical protein